MESLYWVASAGLFCVTDSRLPELSSQFFFCKQIVLMPLPCITCKCCPWPEMQSIQSAKPKH